MGRQWWTRSSKWWERTTSRLGSDFDGGPPPPRGLRDIRDLALITDAMLRRGYSEERIRKFWGGNLMRVFRQVTEKQK